MVGRNCGIVASCLVLVASWLCSFLPVSHDSTRLGLAQGQRPPPSPGTGTAAQVGVLLDLRSAGGRASRASISLALEDFYLSQPGSPRISLHVVDCKDDEITAASAGNRHIYRSPAIQNYFSSLRIYIILCSTLWFVLKRCRLLALTVIVRSCSGHGVASGEAKPKWRRGHVIHAGVFAFRNIAKWYSSVPI